MAKKTPFDKMAAHIEALDQPFADLNIDITRGLVQSKDAHWDTLLHRAIARLETATDAQLPTLLDTIQALTLGGASLFWMNLSKQTVYDSIVTLDDVLTGAQKAAIHRAAPKKNIVFNLTDGEHKVIENTPLVEILMPILSSIQAQTPDTLHGNNLTFKTNYTRCAWADSTALAHLSVHVLHAYHQGYKSMTAHQAVAQFVDDTFKFSAPSKSSGSWRKTSEEALNATLSGIVTTVHSGLSQQRKTKAIINQVNTLMGKLQVNHITPVFKPITSAGARSLSASSSAVTTSSTSSRSSAG